MWLIPAASYGQTARVSCQMWDLLWVESHGAPPSVCDFIHMATDGRIFSFKESSRGDSTKVWEGIGQPWGRVQGLFCRDRSSAHDQRPGKTRALVAEAHGQPRVILPGEGKGNKHPKRLPSSEGSWKPYHRWDSRVPLQG